MKYRKLGKTDIQIPSIIIGAWQAGKKYWVGVEDDQTIKAFQAAYDHGITAFDTAEEYGAGHSERVLGKALGHVREKVVIMSKVFSNHLKYDQVIEACHRSLQNLNTDYMDLYQIHWPSGSWGSEVGPIEETMRALVELKQQGKIRASGVSNFSVAQIEEARAFGPIESVQPPYSLFWRQVEQDLQPWCVQNNLSLLAYSPLAQGILTGKFGPEHRFEQGDNRRANKLLHQDHWPRVQAALSQLREIAQRNQCTLAQLALAWLTAQPNSFAIAGARNADQATSNAYAAEVVFTEEDMNAIDAIGAKVAAPFIEDTVPWSWEP